MIKWQCPKGHQYECSMLYKHTRSEFRLLKEFRKDHKECILEEIVIVPMNVSIEEKQNEK